SNSVDTSNVNQQTNIDSTSNQIDSSNSVDISNVNQHTDIDSTSNRIDSSNSVNISNVNQQTNIDERVLTDVAIITATVTGGLSLLASLLVIWIFWRKRQMI